MPALSAVPWDPSVPRWPAVATAAVATAETDRWVPPVARPAQAETVEVALVAGPQEQQAQPLAGRPVPPRQAPGPLPVPAHHPPAPAALALVPVDPAEVQAARPVEQAAAQRRQAPVEAAVEWLLRWLPQARSHKQHAPVSTTWTQYSTIRWAVSPMEE